MKNSRFNHDLEAALDQLRSEPPGIALSGFEREVWAEIALRDQRKNSGFLSRLLNPRLSRIPAAGAAACGALAVVIGMVAALILAESYAKAASSDLEMRYVASIHPVLRSEIHSTESGSP